MNCLPASREVPLEYTTSRWSTSRGRHKSWFSKSNQIKSPPTQKSVKSNQITFLKSNQFLLHEKHDEILDGHLHDLCKSQCMHGHLHDSTLRQHCQRSDSTVPLSDHHEKPTYIHPLPRCPRRLRGGATHASVSGRSPRTVMNCAEQRLEGGSSGAEEERLLGT